MKKLVAAALIAFANPALAQEQKSFTFSPCDFLAEFPDYSKAVENFPSLTIDYDPQNMFTNNESMTWGFGFKFAYLDMLKENNLSPDMDTLSQKVFELLEEPDHLLSRDDITVHNNGKQTCNGLFSSLRTPGRAPA